MLVDLTKKELQFILTLLSRDKSVISALFPNIDNIDFSENDKLEQKINEYICGYSPIQNTYLVELRYDNGVTVENKVVVTLAFDEDDAFELIKNKLEKSSDDFVTHISTRIMSDTDMIIGHT